MISSLWSNYRYLIARRVVQISIMLLYMAGNYLGWSFLQGNLSSSFLLGIIPLNDPFAVLQMFSAGAILTTNIVVGALIVVFFYSLIGGRVFCSWVCPVNIITDSANYLRNKLGFNKITTKQTISRNSRYWVLILSLILSYVLGITAFEFISPISITHRAIIFGLGLSWAAMLVVFLFDIFILRNGWCGHICPLGGFYSIIGKKSLIRVNHIQQNCTACMECKVVCPESQVLFMVNQESIQVLDGECTNCGRCIEVCNDDALRFSIRNLIKDKK